MLTWNHTYHTKYNKWYREGVCLSSDTKPTNDGKLENGSKLMEMDTSKLYLYDEKNKTWREWS